MNGSTLWAAPNTPLSENITKFPASFTKAMAESEFSHSYYTELTMAAIDSLNTLYVAITRAKQELHLMVPNDANASSVGAIVRGMANISAENPLYEFGTPEMQPKREIKPLSVSKFTTHSPAEKIAVRYTHQRYNEEPDEEYLAPRDYGILMHKAMENATSREDMERALGLLVTDGVITPEEAKTLTAKIDKAMENIIVRSWFDGSWENVRAERDIIFDGRSWRPDRVMIRSKEAVVVDYKFGFNTPASHRRQIERYADLLRQMGYTSVSGYLWYISTERIEQVV